MKLQKLTLYYETKLIKFDSTHKHILRSEEEDKVTVCTKLDFSPENSTMNIVSMYTKVQLFVFMTMMKAQ